MKIKPFYLRSLADLPLEREEFLSRLERAIAFFASLYGHDGMREPGEPRMASAPLELDGECPVSELWSEALLLYMEYLTRGDGDAYTRALASAEGAYRALWRRRAGGKRLKTR